MTGQKIYATRFELLFWIFATHVTLGIAMDNLWLITPPLGAWLALYVMNSLEQPVETYADQEKPDPVKNQSEG